MNLQNYEAMLKVVDRVTALISASWLPLVILFFIRTFKEQISGLINRIKKVKGWGWEAEAEVKEKTEKQTEEMDMRRELENRNRDVIAWSQLYFFERTFRLILNSQLLVLTQLELHVSLNTDTVVSIYNSSESAKFGYPFQFWQGFLVNAQLISISANGIYTLSPNGKDFVNYLNQQDIPKYKGS